MRVWPLRRQTATAVSAARVITATISFLCTTHSELNTWVEHSEPQLLVLDDYHVITEPALHISLASLIERLPAQVHLVLITCVDPPLKLSRLRGRDQVVEVRTDSLRYTVEETGTFLREVMGIHLDPHEVEQVAARTEGWPMGLQFVGLSLPFPYFPGPGCRRE